MAQIHGLALSLGLVGIDEYHLGEQAFLHQAERDGGPYKTAAYHGNFPGIQHMDHPF